MIFLPLVVFVLLAEGGLGRTPPAPAPTAPQRAAQPFSTPMSPSSLADSIKTWWRGGRVHHSSSEEHDSHEHHDDIKVEETNFKTKAASYINDLLDGFRKDGKLLPPPSADLAPIAGYFNNILGKLPTAEAVDALAKTLPLADILGAGKAGITDTIAKLPSLADLKEHKTVIKDMLFGAPVADPAVTVAPAASAAPRSALAAVKTAAGIPHDPLPGLLHGAHHHGHHHHHHTASSSKTTTTTSTKETAGSTAHNHNAEYHKVAKVNNAVGAHYLGAHHLGAHHLGAHHLGAHHVGAHHVGAHHVGAYHHLHHGYADVHSFPVAETHTVTTTYPVFHPTHLVYSPPPLLHSYAVTFP